ncbi:hypothetical protein SteCoe_38098 [Stentor coeruleus]|uniref:Uncharacterized protein n=1 Tax=Stentor coeruleus TaxID=5963 RepID=A0A1R2ALZ0_9CILI|nr:hypothetical protein SteCoe_38098 [Stentor coeruleus]
MGACIRHQRKPTATDVRIREKIMITSASSKQSDIYMNTINDVSEKYMQQPLLLHPMMNSLYSSHLQKNELKELISLEVN